MPINDILESKANALQPRNNKGNESCKRAKKKTSWTSKLKNYNKSGQVLCADTLMYVQMTLRARIFFRIVNAIDKQEIFVSIENQ